MFVSLDRLRFVVLDSIDLRRIETQVQALAQLVNDLVLQIENLGNSAIDLHRLDDLAGAHVDDASGDANHLADFLIAAGQYPARPEMPAQINGNHFVGLRQLA